MRNFIELTFRSVRKQLQFNKFSFELFGYDFLVDDELKTHLIEVNTNPSLEESNKLLKVIMPRMLDNMFTLTVD